MHFPFPSDLATSNRKGKVSPPVWYTCRKLQLISRVGDAYALDMFGK